MSLADRHLSSRVAAEYGTGGRFGWQSAIIQQSVVLHSGLCLKLVHIHKFVPFSINPPFDMDI